MKNILMKQKYNWCAKLKRWPNKKSLRGELEQEINRGPGNS